MTRTEREAKARVQGGFVLTLREGSELGAWAPWGSRAGEEQRSLALV